MLSSVASGVRSVLFRFVRPRLRLRFGSTFAVRSFTSGGSSGEVGDWFDLHGLSKFYKPDLDQDFSLNGLKLLSNDEVSEFIELLPVLPSLAEKSKIRVAFQHLREASAEPQVLLSGVPALKEKLREKGWDQRQPLDPARVLGLSGDLKLTLTEGRRKVDLEKIIRSIERRATSGRRLLPASQASPGMGKSRVLLELYNRFEENAGWPTPIVVTFNKDCSWTDCEEHRPLQSLAARILLGRFGDPDTELFLQLSEFLAFADQFDPDLFVDNVIDLLSEEHPILLLLDEILAVPEYDRILIKLAQRYLTEEGWKKVRMYVTSLRHELKLTSLTDKLVVPSKAHAQFSPFGFDWTQLPRIEIPEELKQTENLKLAASYMGGHARSFQYLLQCFDDVKTENPDVKYLVECTQDRARKDFRDHSVTALPGRIIKKILIGEMVNARDTIGWRFGTYVSYDQLLREGTIMNSVSESDGRFAPTISPLLLRMWQETQLDGILGIKRRRNLDDSEMNTLSFCYRLRRLLEWSRVYVDARFEADVADLFLLSPLLRKFKRMNVFQFFPGLVHKGDAEDLEKLEFSVENGQYRDPVPIDKVGAVIEEMRESKQFGVALNDFSCQRGFDLILLGEVPFLVEAKWTSKEEEGKLVGAAEVRRKYELSRGVFGDVMKWSGQELANWCDSIGIDPFKDKETGECKSGSYLFWLTEKRLMDTWGYDQAEAKRIIEAADEEIIKTGKLPKETRFLFVTNRPLGERFQKGSLGDDVFVLGRKQFLTMIGPTLAYLPQFMSAKHFGELSEVQTIFEPEIRKECK